MYKLNINIYGLTAFFSGFPQPTLLIANVSVFLNSNDRLYDELTILSNPGLFIKLLTLK